MFTGLKGKDYYDRLRQMNLWTLEEGGITGSSRDFRDVGLQRIYQDERKWTTSLIDSNVKGEISGVGLSSRVCRNSNSNNSHPAYQ